jgi:transcriptional accessory protein Tex/SPT6
MKKLFDVSTVEKSVRKKIVQCQENSQEFMSRKKLGQVQIFLCQEKS